MWLRCTCDRAPQDGGVIMICSSYCDVARYRLRGVQENGDTKIIGRRLQIKGSCCIWWRPDGERGLFISVPMMADSETCPRSLPRNTDLRTILKPVITTRSIEYVPTIESPSTLRHSKKYILIDCPFSLWCSAVHLHYFFMRRYRHVYVQ